MRSLNNPAAEGVMAANCPFRNRSNPPLSVPIQTVSSLSTYSALIRSDDKPSFAVYRLQRSPVKTVSPSSEPTQSRPSFPTASARTSVNLTSPFAPTFVKAWESYRVSPLLFPNQYTFELICAIERTTLSARLSCDVY